MPSVRNARRLGVALVLLFVTTAAFAQAPPRRGAHRLSGPRVGVTYLNDDNVRTINETFGSCEGFDPDTGRCRDEGLISSDFPVVTQFGWQFERQIAVSEKGLTGVTEVVLLAGGLERGLFLPSASFIVGARTPGGVEIGFGPNVSATGAAYAVAVGFANPLGDFSLPVNLAAVLGREGPRFSLLVGMTFSDSRY